MQRNIRETSVVNNAASLEGKEGLAVDFEGKIPSAGAATIGIVTQGRPKNMASVVAYEGQMEAEVDGSGTQIDLNDPLTPNDGGSLVKNTGFGSTMVSAYAMEGPITSAKKIKISIA